MTKPKPNYGTSNGVPITEELIEDLAARAEAGFDVERIKRTGRPRMGSAPAEIVPVRLDPDLRSALDERAQHDGTSASEIIRRALRDYLRAS